MRLNNSWLENIDDSFGQVDSFKIYSGSLPSSVATPPTVPGGYGDIDTATVETNGMLIPEVNTPATVKNMQVRPSDGARVFYSGSGFIYQYDVGDPGVYINLSNQVSKPLNGQTSINSTISLDGNTIYFCMEQDGEGVALGSYGLTSPYDISTMDASAVLVALTGYDFTVDLFVTPDESKVYMLNRGGTGQVKIGEFTMSTPGDISTATLNSEFSLPDQAQYITMSSDGTKIYYQNGYSTTAIHQLDLSTPYDLSTVSDPVKSLDVGIQTTSICWDDFNDKLYTFDVDMDYMTPINLPDGEVEVNPLADLSNSFISDIDNTFSPIQDGTAVKMVWQGSQVQTTADADGDMGYFIMQCSGNGKQFKVDGTITDVGGGGDIEFTSATLATGDIVALNSIDFVFNDVYMGVDYTPDVSAPVVG